MRKVTAGLFISLDGVVESPHLWQFDMFNEEMEEAMFRLIAPIDTVLMGRVTYEEWAPYWPAATDGYAGFINPVPKYVASTTLRQVDWQNSMLITGDVAAAVRDLKARPGGVIGVQGSPTLIRYLIANGLLDELTLTIHPVIVGSGKRLFTGDSELKRVRLIDHSVTRTGVILATYNFTA